MENRILDYVISLAEIGETPLIVRQIPLMRGGVHQQYLDGSYKYTWPAYLPAHKRKKGEAWYINTGSFIVERLKDRISAATSNCEYVLFMMLDDIGTKSKIPPLKPTWIVETSPGNFQWCYAFKEQPTVGEYCAAITAIADAGYTDKGATNAVRNCRLPGSVNLKPGRDAFTCVEIEFNPIDYTLKEICDALGVVPGEASTSTYKSVTVEDTGIDNVMTWLNEQGLVLSRPNPAGWMGVVCPNHEEHSDGQIEGRYKPLDRSYCCKHAHCEHLNSEAFLTWVADNGGPRERQGIRGDLIANEFKAMFEGIKPNEFYPDVAAERVAQVDREEAGRVERGSWYERFAYIVDDDAYFDMTTRNEISRGSFNAIFRHINCTSVHNQKRRIEASVCFDENRQEHKAKLLKGLTYAAGEKILVHKDGEVYGNRWRDARPDVARTTSDISRFTAHCERLVADEAERNHCYDVMAFKLQHPEVKVNHAVLHGGDEGSGKDTMWAPFIWSVCGPNNHNWGIIDNESLSSQWGYQLESEILILNELREPEARERRALANKLKPIIAAPPDMLPINRKGLHPYEMINRLLVLAFTNDPIPISIPSQDRRWFCLWSTAPRMSPDEAREIWAWYKSGGFEAIAAWLYARDVSKFNPTAAPPITDFKLSLVEHGMSMAESFIVEMARGRKGDFAAGVIGGPFHDICSRLSVQAGNGVKVPQAALLHALKEAGWIDCGRLHSGKHQTKRHVFCAPEMASHKNSDLRNMCEPNPTPSLQVVK